MRALVIGGTQFMGRETVKRLVERGHDVSVLHRSGSHDLGPSVRNLQADRGDLDALTRIVREHDFEAVFDFAYDWEKGTTPEQVLAGARACGPSLLRYVFISSVAAYSGGTRLPEDAPLVPDDSRNDYARHKAAAERALFDLHRTIGFPVVTFRPPFVHGPRQPFYREQFFWDRLRDGRPIILPEGGSTPMQWVYVSDVADACMLALDVPGAVGEAFNVAHAEDLDQRSFVEALARAAGVEPRFVSIPRDTILAAGGRVIGGNLYFGEVLDLPPLAGAIDKVRRVLGFEPTPLDDALRTTYAWYLEQSRRPVDYSFEDGLLAAAGQSARGLGQSAP